MPFLCVAWTLPYSYDSRQSEDALGDAITALFLLISTSPGRRLKRALPSQSEDRFTELDAGRAFGLRAVNWRVPGAGHLSGPMDVILLEGLMEQMMDLLGHRQKVPGWIPTYERHSSPSRSEPPPHINY